MNRGNNIKHYFHISFGINYTQLGICNSFFLTGGGKFSVRKKIYLVFRRVKQEYEYGIVLGRITH
jgi:hypothetical protein